MQVFWQPSSCNVTAPNDELSTHLSIYLANTSILAARVPILPNLITIYGSLGRGGKEFLNSHRYSPSSTICSPPPQPYRWWPSRVDLNCLSEQVEVCPILNQFDLPDQ